MSYQILPNWFKKIGFTLFFVFSILDGGEHFTNRLLGQVSHTGIFSLLKAFAGGNKFFDSLIIIGLLLYMFSKEKIEDDYIKILRYESYQIATMLYILIALILFILSVQITFYPANFITGYILLYLIIFYFKKRMFS